MTLFPAQIIIGFWHKFSKAPDLNFHKSEFHVWIWFKNFVGFRKQKILLTYKCTIMGETCKEFPKEQKWKLFLRVTFIEFQAPRSRGAGSFSPPQEVLVSSDIKRIITKLRFKCVNVNAALCLLHEHYLQRRC